MKTLRRIALVSAALTLAACLPERDQPAKPASSLATAQIPPGFDFATSRVVELHLSAARIGALRISTASGALLFSGTLTPQKPLRFSVPLATREQKLVAELRVGGEAQSADVAIVGGVAEHAFN